jgi:hypothetical protein
MGHYTLLGMTDHYTLLGMTGHYTQAFNFDLFEPFICYNQCPDLTSVQQHWNGHCFCVSSFLCLSTRCVDCNNEVTKHSPTQTLYSARLVYTIHSCVWQCILPSLVLVLFVWIRSRIPRIFLNILHLFCKSFGHLIAGIAVSNTTAGMDVLVMCWLCVLYVAVSATSWSLVQRIPTVRCVYICVRVCARAHVCVWERERSGNLNNEAA